jgi:6-phosphogluconolactonase (cycloisomerase 2 family)
MPEGVQYLWRHASKPFVYLACSDGKPGFAGTRHFVCAMKMDAAGALSPHGEPVALRVRPVHLSTDRDSRHVLIAYPYPSGVSVHRIEADGTLGAEVPQPPMPPLAKTAHQILVTPANDRVVLPLRGNDAASGRPEDPGALAIFDYSDGKLAHRETLAPEGGYGFGPRHVDFHPSRPWLFMSIERQNQIAMFGLGERVEGPKYRTSTLARPHEEKPRQLVGAIHVHPSGRFVYVSNRADGTIEVEGTKVFNGGENSIAVFAIDANSGKPTLIQNADTRGMHPRTFHIHPSGKLLVVANMTSRDVREGGEVRNVPGGLSVFRVGDDGKLEFIRKYDADVSREHMFWMGMVRVA